MTPDVADVEFEGCGVNHLPVPLARCPTAGAAAIRSKHECLVVGDTPLRVRKLLLQDGHLWRGGRLRSGGTVAGPDRADGLKLKLNSGGGVIVVFSDGTQQQLLQRCPIAVIDRLGDGG